VLELDHGVIAPAFHDGHMHLLRHVRQVRKVNVGGCRSLGELHAALRDRAAELPPAAWVRAVGYDEHLLGRHPDRHDLDAAVHERPIRMDHRALHVSVLNSAALAVVGDEPCLERDAQGQPTGRVFHGGEWLSSRMPRPSREEIAADVRSASERLLSWGVTTVQDASVTNGPDQWRLFQQLAQSGDLGVRMFMMAGAAQLGGVDTGCAGPLDDDPPRGRRVRLGPVKVMVDEARSDPQEVALAIKRGHEAGRRVAVHAATEAELAMALPHLRAGDRVEHGAVIPDEWLAGIKDKALIVVGQPALAFQRGDIYAADHPPEQHGWLHRARSLVEAGIPYAIGSDAPVTEPSPALMLHAAQNRKLGEQERLTKEQALDALTRAPARAVGVEHELGQLKPGMLADLVVLDPDFADDLTPRQTRLTMMEGQNVWMRPS